MELQNSISSEVIQEHLSRAHSISEDLDQSSILEQLKKIVGDLFLCQEKNISLESQLKIALETIKLQEAEFAFQKSEYEAEIQSLKQKEALLQENISNQNLQNQRLKYDVNVKVDADKNSAIIQKYEKWKRKTKELEIKNKELTQKVDYLQNYINSSASLDDRNDANEIKNAIDKPVDSDYSTEKSKVKSLKAEIKKNLSQHKKDLESLHTQISKLKNDKEELKLKIRQMKTDIQNKEIEIKSMTDEQSGNQNSTQTISNRMATIEEENQRLRLQLKSLSKKNHHLQSIADQSQKQQLLLQHVEIEYNNLCDIVGVEPGEIGKQWSSLSNECEKFSNLSDTVDELKMQNTTLQKRFTSIMNEKRKETPKKSLSNEFQESDTYLEKVLEEVKSLKKAKDQLENQLEQYKYVEKFSSRISNIYALLVRQIDDIHDSIIGFKSTKMRPVILSILFARRFLLFSKNDTINDETALQIFGGRLNFAADTKLSEIKEKISILCEDLYDAKKQLAYYTTLSKQAEEENGQTQFELQNSSDRLVLATKQLKYLKIRMSELQNELSTLIPSDVHNNTVEELSKTKKKNQKLKKQISHLQQELEKQLKYQKELKKEFNQQEWDSSRKLQDYNDLKDQLLSKEHEFEVLKTMLNEKNKEVLALERLISRQKTKSLSKSYNFMPYSTPGHSSEGIDIRKTSNTPYATKKERKVIAALDNTPTGLASIVNPTFLK